LKHDGVVEGGTQTLGQEEAAATKETISK